jgi:hypothetical protein
MFQIELQLDKSLQHKQIRLQVCHDTSLDDWIAERHYLKSVPCGARLRLWILDANSEILGAMMWGRPTSRMLDQWLILENTRMYFIDDTEPFIESKALGMARKYIRKHFPEIKLLVGYSAINFDHCGVVYRADNWCPFGITKGGSWNNNVRKNRKNIDTGEKIRWVRSP